MDLIQSWILTQNKSMILDDEEVTVLELVGKVGQKTNELVTEVNGKVDIVDLETNRHLSADGNFTGLLNGAPIIASDLGLTTTVADLVVKSDSAIASIALINTNITDHKASNDASFLAINTNITDHEASNDASFLAINNDITDHKASNDASFLAINNEIDGLSLLIGNGDGITLNVKNLPSPLVSLLGDGSDETINILALITWANGLTYPIHLEFPHGIYKCNLGFSVNPMRISASFIGATLDFSSMLSGTAIKFEGIGTAGQSISSNKTRAWEGLWIRGNNDITLIDVSTNGSSNSAGITLKHICFDTYAIGLNIGNNGWQINLREYSFINGAVGSAHINMLQDADPTPTNFGEMLSCIGGLHSGNGVAYKSSNYNSDAYFDMVSFDCAKVVELSRGAKAFISHSHIEPSGDINTLFEIEGTLDGFSGALCSLRDSWMMLSGIRNYAPFTVGKVYSVGNGGLSIDNLFLTLTLSSTVPKLVDGSGRVNVRALKTNYDFKSYVIADSINELQDGGFELGTFTEWTIDYPSSPPVIDSSILHSGSNSLKFVGDGGSIVSTSITRGVKVGQNVFLGIFYKLVSVVQGVNPWNKFSIFVRVYNKQGEILSIDEETYIDGTIDWLLFTSQQLRQSIMPKGADHITITIQMNGCTGIAYVDDIVLNIID